jgi:flavin reductase (DIM6/NTAB) family NADH-FMN oxidoreductase RutF
MNLNALNKISYGMYIVGSHKGEKLNAQIANSVMQITSEPPTVAVSINKKNLTYEYIKESKAFAVSILCQSTPLPFIGNFGFKSGRDIDKFKDINYKVGKTGSPVVIDYVSSYFEAEVLQEIDAGTHAIFVGKVVEAEVLNDMLCMTYEYYHLVKKGTTPKTAPSYVFKKSEEEVKMDKYECTMCGYVYDPAQGDPDSGIKPGTPFDKLPADWVCPVCGAAKSDFKKIE